MNTIRKILVVAVCAISNLALAQNNHIKAKPKPAPKPESAKPVAATTNATLMDTLRKQGADNLNKLDENGNRHGYWWINEPALRGEEAYTTFGTYDHGQKTGKWYKTNDQGEVLSIENYTFDVLNGEAKYFDRGRVTSIGNYRGLNPTHEFDTVAVVDPATGAETLRAIPSDKGSVRHGLWRYYDMNTGMLVREEEYQVDELIYRKDFNRPQQDSVALKKQDEKLKREQAGPYYSPPKKKQVSYTEFNAGHK